MLLVSLKFSSLFRSVCSLIRISLVPFERLSRSSGLLLLLKFSSFFRAVCSSFFESLQSLSSGLLLVSLKFSSLFRSVCSLIRISLVPFERLSRSSGLLLLLKFSSSFRAVGSLSFEIL